MSDFEHKLRQHYQGQALSDERIRRILAAGRDAAAARARRRYLLAAAAAVVVAGIGLFSFRGNVEIARPEVATAIRVEDAGAAVMSLFAQADYKLSHVSSNLSELTGWLRTHGAPPTFTVPARMAALPGFGCHVLEVKGQSVFLICFFLEVTPAELAAGGMIKNEMVVTAPDGTMMKKSRPLVHLLIAPNYAFLTPPKPGSRVQFAGSGDWNFEAWTEEKVVYIAGGVAVQERLAEIARPI